MVMQKNGLRSWHESDVECRGDVRVAPVLYGEGLWQVSVMTGARMRRRLLLLVVQVVLVESLREVVSGMDGETR